MKVVQSFPTLCNPTDCSLPGSSVHGILQARILEWVGVPFSKGSSYPRDWTQVSHIVGGFFTGWATRETQEPEEGSLSLLQGIFFPTQESNWGLLHCRKILYQLSYKRSPRTLEWIAYPFSRGSSGSRNWTRVSCIAGGFFTNWAIREAPSNQTQHHSICLTGKISQQNGNFLLRYQRPVRIYDWVPKARFSTENGAVRWKTAFEANLSFWETVVICLFI